MTSSVLILALRESCMLVILVSRGFILMSSARFRARAEKFKIPNESHKCPMVSMISRCLFGSVYRQMFLHHKRFLLKGFCDI